jgi:putative SOS response-associated peptidase YedK
MRLLHGSHANRDWATVQSFRRVSGAISRLLLDGKASRSSLSAAYTDRLDKPDRRAIQPEVDLVVLEPVSDARQATDKAGNPGLAFPASSHQFRPIVPNGADGERELVMARWGMPGPLQFGGQPVTNIRNVSSPHWRGWLSARTRCLVPATSFCEYAPTTPRKTPTWFALSEDRRCSPSRDCGPAGGPKSAPVEGELELFGFLTTEANSIVAPIHPKAMPVVLATAEEFDLWLEGETVESLKLQRPLPDGMLDIVARAEIEDGASDCP